MISYVKLLEMDFPAMPIGGAGEVETQKDDSIDQDKLKDEIDKLPVRKVDAEKEIANYQREKTIGNIKNTVSGLNPFKATTAHAKN